MDPKAFYAMSYGVYVVSTWDNGRPTGCTANCAAQITSAPATVMVSINKDNYTNRCIRDCGHFAISILAETSEPSVIGRFGFRSGRDTDKFDGVPYSIRDKLPILDDCCAYIACKVIDKMETSTHTVFLGEVIGAETLKKGTPMTYAYYHNVIKGKTGKNSPTYVAEEQTPATTEKYVCSVCKYVYVGDVPFENLPEDWTCPICGAPKSKFEKM